MATQTVAGLDLIRFAAALMVAWYHLAYWSWYFPPSSTAKILAGAASFPSLAPWSRWGWVGVEIFFVLSGYVIASSAQSKSARAFVRSRFLRLYPGLWICAAVAMVWLASFAVYPTDDIIARLLRSWIIWPVGSWVDGVYWTLVVEIVFYALIFVVLCFGWNNRLPVILGCIGWASSAFWFASAAGADLTFVLDSDQSWAFSLLPFGCFFALGGYIWLAVTARPRWWHWAVIGPCLIAGATEIYRVPILSPETAGNPHVPVVIWGAAVALITISALKADRINQLVGRGAGGVRLTGLATYPLYLLHNTTGPGLIRLLAGSGVPQYFALALAMSGVIALSYLVAAFFEPALRRSVEWLIARRLLRPFRRNCSGN